MNSETEKEIRIVFLISLIIKGLIGVFEALGGILLFFTGSLTSFLYYLIRTELIEDPTDVVANQTQHFLHYFFGSSQIFGAAYLLFHGVIKLFLVINLMRDKTWAYPVAVWVMLAFILYEVFRYSFSHSILLFFVIIFDCLVLWLTWHEWNIAKQTKR